MIDEFRLLIFEVTGRQILFLSFKNPKSTINNQQSAIINHQFIPSDSQPLRAGCRAMFVPPLSAHRRCELPTTPRTQQGNNRPP